MTLHPLLKKKRIRLLIVALLVLGFATFRAATAVTARIVEVPAGVYEVGSPDDETNRWARRDVETEGFRMRATEVTVRQFVRFLNMTRPDPVYRSPQIDYSWGRYRPRVDAKQAVAHVSLDDAERYVTWLSRKKRVDARLPTADEWEIAARGGVARARYPWGWGSPEGRAQFNADGVGRVAQFESNPLGLYDMAGSVAEWCAPEPDDAAKAYALGGSWAERSEDQLRVYHRTPFPREYRDADVGIRVLLEMR